MNSNFTKMILTLFVIALTIGSVNAQMQYRRALDFDGDQKADLTVLRYTSSAANWYTRNSSNGQLRANQYGMSGTGGASGNAFDTPVTGDFDGDGKADYAVVRRGQGAHTTWFILRSQTNTMTADRFGTSTDAVMAGDYDGDGKTDMGVLRRAPGENGYTVYIQQTSNNQMVSRNQSFDINPTGQTSGCDIQTGVDIDGDGKQDLAQVCFNTGSMVWVVKRAADNVTERYYWGRIDSMNNWDYPVPADYDGDGKTDIAVIRFVYPGSGDYYNYHWYIRHSSTGAMQTAQFGHTTFGSKYDAIVPADYDGDGKADIAVWRSIINAPDVEPAYLYLMRSGSGNSFQAIQWGLSSDFLLQNGIKLMPSA